MQATCPAASQARLDRTQIQPVLFWVPRAHRVLSQTELVSRHAFYARLVQVPAVARRNARSVPLDNFRVPLVNQHAGNAPMVGTPMKRHLLYVNHASEERLLTTWVLLYACRVAPGGFILKARALQRHVFNVHPVSLYQPSKQARFAIIAPAENSPHILEVLNAFLAQVVRFLMLGPHRVLPACLESF
jgi:hypothetical protein